MKKKIKFIKVTCKDCGKAIYRSLGRINENLKLGNNFFCSKKCESKYKTKRKKLTCENCGKLFERSSGQMSSHNYCSLSCAAIVNNRNYPKKHAKFQNCIKCGKKFKRKSLNQKYCSLECRKKAEWYTPRKILKIIKEAVQKTKRVPSRRELRGINNACKRFFGSWNSAVLAAGFTPNRSYNDRMYKRIRAKSLDGHKCDSASEVLIDNWLYKNKIKHKKDAPYPNTNHKADWSINSGGEMLFIEYFGLAKDCRHYDRNITKKRKLCRKHKIKMLEIFPQDLYPKVNLNRKLKSIIT